MDRAVSRRVAVWALPLALGLAGCDLSLGHLSARATDEWRRGRALEPDVKSNQPFWGGWCRG